MLKTFEKEGHCYQISELTPLQDIDGHWCCKFEWNKDTKTWNECQNVFIPATLRPTRQELLQCFQYGGAFVVAYRKRQRTLKRLSIESDR